MNQPTQAEIASCFSPEEIEALCVRFEDGDRATQEEVLRHIAERVTQGVMRQATEMVAKYIVKNGVLVQVGFTSKLQ